MRLIRRAVKPTPPPAEARIKTMYQSRLHPEWYALFLCTKDNPSEFPMMVDGVERWIEVPLP